MCDTTTMSASLSVATTKKRKKQDHDDTTPKPKLKKKKAAPPYHCDSSDDDELAQEEEEQQTKVKNSSSKGRKKKVKQNDTQEEEKEESENDEHCGITSSKGSSKSNNATTSRSAAVIHEEDFYHYVNFRILDSIGYPGAYRKFMVRRRDQGADWAVKMNDHVIMVQYAVKELAFLEQDIKNSMVLKNLDVVWQHVVESNTPPSDLHLTIGTCLITNKTNVPCIVIRGKGRGAHNFTVSSKFSNFLYHLWIIYKMDILIKVYTRKSLEEIDERSTLSLMDIAEKFKERDHEIRSFARSFHSAYTHVYRSAMGGLMAVV